MLKQVAHGHHVSFGAGWCFGLVNGFVEGTRFAEGWRKKIVCCGPRVCRLAVTALAHPLHMASCFGSSGIVSVDNPPRAGAPEGAALS